MSLASVQQFAQDWVRSRRWPLRPENVSFEITAACDARCIHCPRYDMDRPMKAMPMPLFRRLVDQAAEMGVPYLCPNGYGEICTIPLPALAEYFDYIASKGHPFRIIINTNGYRMNEERAALFIKHRVHVINVTIDGATAATAEAIRKNLKFDDIEANIKRLITMRNAAGLTRPKVRVGMVEMPQTQPEIPQFLERWKGIADWVGIGGFSTRLESVSETWRKADDAHEPPVNQHRPTACVLPFRDLNIWADGGAVICCEDWNETQPVGNLNTQTLAEIWHGPLMTEVRQKHMARAGHEIALCAKCNIWRQPGSGARLWK